MSVVKLPTTVETIINNLLSEVGLSTYKITGNADSTTVILRFCKMAGHSEIRVDRRQTPASLKYHTPRTPPNHPLPDQSVTEIKDSGFVCTPPTSSDRNDIFCETPSSSPTTMSQTKIRSPPLTSSPLNSPVLHPKSFSDDKKCAVFDENKLQGKSNAVNLSIEMTESKPTKCQLDPLSPTPQRSDSEGPTHSNIGEANENKPTTEEDNSKTSKQVNVAATPIPIGTKGSRPESKICGNVLFDESVFTEIQFVTYSRNIPEVTKTNIKDTKRNTVFKRIAKRESTDGNQDTFSILAETDDLIIEYSPSKRKALRYFVVPGYSDVDKELGLKCQNLQDFVPEKSDLVLLKHAMVDLLRLLKRFFRMSQSQKCPKTATVNSYA